MFNGTNAQVTVPNAASLQLTTGMTLEAWVFPTTTPTGWRAIVDKNVDGYYLMASTDNGNRPGVGGTWTDGNKNVFGPSVLPVNTWTHLASTFDGSTVRLFVNGVQVASQAQTAALQTTTATLQIGADAYPTEYFAGLIDEVRIYNRALSAAEIQSRHGHVGEQRDAASARRRYHRAERARRADRHGFGLDADQSRLGRGHRQRRRHRLPRGALRGRGLLHFVQIATPTATSFSDTGLTAGTSYSYRVRATDAAGNLGGYSNTASATTTAAGHTTPPSAPPTLSATAASATQINLVWTAATDNVGVTGYRVERCQGSGCTTFTQIFTLSGTTFSNLGLTASTSYSYRVRAVDAAGNLGPLGHRFRDHACGARHHRAHSADRRWPRPGTQVNLAWTASTDNVGVTGYQILRCTGSTCTTFRSHLDRYELQQHGLAPSTTYRFRVRAVDGAGNVAATRTSVNATTGAAPAERARRPRRGRGKPDPDQC